MNHHVRIMTPISDFQVLQQVNGKYPLFLEGQYQLRSVQDKVICIVRKESDNAIVHTVYPAMNEVTWHVKITLEAGDVYRLETGLLLEETGYDVRFLACGDIIRHLGVGEVFVIAGQSNAVGYARGVIDDAPMYGVFMLDRRRRWSLASHPIGYVDADKENATLIASGHSPWLALGKHIWTNNHQPVGLIPLALNGSSLEAWCGDEPLNKALKKALSMSGHMVFYQGCTDTVNGHETYEKRLRAFVNDVRATRPDIKLYLTQISGTRSTDAADAAWKAVREAQHVIAEEACLPLIVTHDLTNYSDDIHVGEHDNLRIATRVYAAYMGRTLTTIRRADRVKADTIRLTLSSDERLSIPTPLPLGVEGKKKPLRVVRIWQDRYHLYVKHEPGDAVGVFADIGSAGSTSFIRTSIQPLPAFRLTMDTQEKTADTR